MPKSLLRHALYIILFSKNDFEKTQPGDDHDRLLWDMDEHRGF